MRHVSSQDGILVPFLLCFLSSGVFQLKAESLQSHPTAPIEITQIDLFSLRGWNSMQVSVLGFRLGMGRKEISGAAQAASVTLDDKSGKGCLKEQTCNVYGSGKYNGVSLTFNAEDSLEKITIEVYQQGVPREEQSALLVNRFQGKTRQLAITYSENLRLGILGAADTFRASDISTRKSRWRLKPSEDWQSRNLHREHQYSRLGLILAVDVLSYWIAVSDGETVRKLAFEFARPKTGLP